MKLRAFIVFFMICCFSTAAVYADDAPIICDFTEYHDGVVKHDSALVKNTVLDGRKEQKIMNNE